MPDYETRELCSVDWGSATVSQRCVRAVGHPGNHMDTTGHVWQSVLFDALTRPEAVALDAALASAYADSRHAAHMVNLNSKQVGDVQYSRLCWRLLNQQARMRQECTAIRSQLAREVL